MCTQNDELALISCINNVIYFKTNVMNYLNQGVLQQGSNTQLEKDVLSFDATI